jgi:hypothetical protein
MMKINENIINYFGSRLIRRSVNLDISNSIENDNLYILSEIGLPNKVLDFEFTNEIEFNAQNEVIIGKTYASEDIVLNIVSNKIVRSNDNCFLANSLENYLKQLYTYDHLWEITIKESHFGKYRENKNHTKYAKYLETQLLKIDPELLRNDSSFFWGSLIEDIEFGVVG